METLFLDTLNRSLAAGWVVLAVLLLRLLLRKAPKSLHVLLWAFVAVRLLCPVLPESSFSLLSHPAPVTQEFLDELPGWLPNAQDAPDAPKPTFSGEIAEEHPDVLPASRPEIRPEQIGTAIWLLGMGGLGLYTSIRYGQLHRKLRTAIRTDAGVFRSEYVSSPFVLGLFRPKIVLPFRLSEADFPHVLAHEQAHIRHGDPFWKMLAFLFVCVYWFHPLLWLAYLLFCRDLEFACDERVVRTYSSAERAAYAQTLLTCSTQRMHPAPLSFVEGDVRSRVRAVLQPKKPSFWLLLLAALLILGTAICFLTNPYSLRPDAFPWVFSHVQSGETVVYASPALPPLYDTAQPLRLHLYADHDTLFLKNPADGTVYELPYVREQGLSGTVLYRISYGDTKGWLILSETTWENPGMEGQIIGTGDTMVSLPAHALSKTTLLLSMGDTVLYFYAADGGTDTVLPLPANLHLLDEHVFPEPLPEKTLQKQAEEIRTYRNGAMMDAVDAVFRDWGCRIDHIACVPGQNYVTVIVHDFSEGDIGRFRKAFGHGYTSYQLLQTDATLSVNP